MELFIFKQKQCILVGSMETETSPAFYIKHDTFEGPLEVLLELVEKRKLFVNDISLASVTDDFITYIRDRGMYPDMVSSFLHTASTLILIKARSLLPTLELTPDEENSIVELKERVALLALIQERSVVLTKQFRKTIYSGHYIHKKEVQYTPPSPSVTPAFLLGLIAEMSVRIPPKKVTPPETRVYKTISIKEVINTLTERIEKVLSCNFNDICVTSPDGDDKSTRVYTIISFLGMLELVRQGMIVAEQNGLFENIALQKSGTQITEKVVE